jgi:beta-glucosidase
MIEDAVALAQKSDAVVIVAGILEGEARDRAHLDLPGDQTEMIQAVAATGKPVVVVLVAGGPVTMEKWGDRVGAIVNAWYPGQEGGTAIADILFGDVNPSGKLPMTFPLNIGQVPTYYNMEPSGRGYDYVDLTGKPKFAFGHGLSYTTFEYTNLKLSATKINSKQPVTVSFVVANTGEMAGDEVPQLYIRDMVASIVRPMKELRDFVRISLKPGEKKTISFTLKPEQLSFLDAKMKPTIEPGTFEVYVGSSSDDIRLKSSFEVVGK